MSRLLTALDSFTRNGLIMLLALVLAPGAFLGGCQLSLFNVPGQSIENADRIIVKGGGQQTGQYRSDELVVNYEYVRHGDSLKISGVVRFSDSIQGLFSTVSTFNLALVLADPRGIVLAQQGLTTAHNHKVGEPVAFSTTMVIPSQTASMAFRYTGAAAGSGKDGSPSPFWHDPVAR
jgi:hypothetical protein